MGDVARVIQEVFVGIGSNLGNRLDNINKAIEYLKAIDGISIDKVSSIIETKPQNANGPDYLNAAIKLATNILPKDLLSILQECEKSLGRVKTFKNAPRTIDLDILFYGNEAINTPELTIPHPKIHERDFVMTPLKEINPKALLTKKARLVFIRS